ncbi:unnamed protein product [Polarella glacialis]|nr:unnamed protein product [Polarella glacialis]CAE8678992.1 unnamed protein product [Polarella glacialis]
MDVEPSHSAAEEEAVAKNSLAEFEPVIREEKLPGLSLEMIRAALEGEEFMPRFYRENIQAKDISPSHWGRSLRTKGTLFRKLTFVMPVPQDAPRAIARLVSVPLESTVTALWHLSCQEGQVTLTYQSCTHDVPFGENFRVQETIVFRPSSSGELCMTKWAECVWVAPLPWTHGVIKAFIEKRCKAEATGAVPLFLRLVREHKADD